MNKIKVILADDHQLIREALKILLNSEKDIEIIAEAADGFEVIELAKVLMPDIILMDMSMPKISGDEVTKILLKENKNIKIIMLSANSNEVFIKAALKAGAKTYLHKNVSKDELIRAIRLIYKQEVYISNLISETLYKSFLQSIGQSNSDNVILPLTLREIEIVKLFAKGYSFKQIAAELNISTRTVESHKRRIMKKLHLEKTTELIRYAIKNNLIDYYE